MASFAVSIDVITQDISLREVTAALGIEPSSSSHEKGEIRSKSELWRETIWRLESGVESSSPLIEHLHALSDKLSLAGLAALRIESRRLSVCLNVAAFFDTANCVVLIPSEYLRWLSKEGIALELSAYPCSSVDGGTDPSRMDTNEAQEA
jgi:hypothetical protein